jgi:hypothetical protein
MLAYICKVTQKFDLKRRRKRTSLCLEYVGQWSPSLVNGGIFFKGLGKRGRVKLDHPLLQVEVSTTSITCKKEG